MTVRSSHHGKRRFFYYICASFDHRGRSVCANNLPLPMEAADHAILSKLRGYVLDPEIVVGAIEDALAELRPSAEAVEATRATLEADFHRIEAEQARYAAAVATA